MGQLLEFDHEGVSVSGYLAEPEGTPKGGLVVPGRGTLNQNWIRPPM